jgi:hypothetical protein
VLGGGEREGWEGGGAIALRARALRGQRAAFFVCASVQNARAQATAALRNHKKATLPCSTRRATTAHMKRPSPDVDYDGGEGGGGGEGRTRSGRAGGAWAP